LSLLLGSTATVPTSAQGTASCSDYDAWEWAQSVFESDPTTYDALDPDNDGIACPELPKGFAPAFWTDEMPKDVQQGTILRAIDGDTFEIAISGDPTTVRIYRADTPENTTERHCGGQQATDFAMWALSFNDQPGVVYIEKDKTEKDRHGRELAYIWFEIDGQPYLLNHVLIKNGYAEDIDYGDRKYNEQLKDAAAFAKRHDLGVWDLCGGFGRPEAPAPTAAPQPTQAPAIPPPTQPPAAPADPPAASGCDPNYTPCVPISSADLDCGDIGHMTVQVVGVDVHGFDGTDNDGWGCE
jgi:endonuclease YncB( thermonuclease family)